jgi:muramoyltetrapeptide carboxypeptidase
VGFSDITLLHAHIIGNYQIACIHGQMPLNIPDASAYSLETLRMALFGEELCYNCRLTLQTVSARPMPS